LHETVEHELKVSRDSFNHPVVKGDASENSWLDLLRTYLPRRYEAHRAFVVDSNGKFSQQIDIVISDRQYSPFIFSHKGQLIVPAESVYAVLETKQSINATNIEYAQDKVESVRALHRTSLPVPTLDGVRAPKQLFPILGGLLAFESDWRSPPLGDALMAALSGSGVDQRLDLGCVARHGSFQRDDDGSYTVKEAGKPSTAFIFELITRLQQCGTVPMIDLAAYARWL